MTGLFFLFVVAVWFFFVWWLTLFLTRRMEAGLKAVIAKYLLFLVLLVAPLIDEIVGGRQFAQLCNDNSIIQVDRAKAVGRTVYLNSLPEIDIRGTWVPIRMHRWQFVDATTGELIVSYSSLHAEGGRIIRMLGILEGNAPLTFNGSCEPEGSPASIETFKKFGITYIEPPISKNGTMK